MKNLILVVTFLGLVGCAGRLVVMKDPQNGNVQKCEVSAGQQMALGVLANAQVTNCIKSWEAAGYKRVN